MAQFSKTADASPYSADSIALGQKFIDRGPHLLLIGGEWRPAKTEKTFEVVDPATGKIVARVASGGAEDVDAAVDAARSAFLNPLWREMSAHDRERMLSAVADSIEYHREELAVIQSRDLGANPALSRALVDGAVEAFRYYAGWPTKICGASYPSGPGSVAVSVREPLGVVGAIIPWNGPVQSSSWKIAAALACGNSVVLKAASEAPLVCVRLCELMADVLPVGGLVNLLTGSGSDVGSVMAAHQGIDKIAFTGSTETGREILKASASNLKKLTLELGGKSPTIIFADADLDAAIPAAATSFISGAGQNCVAGSRILVERAVYEEVIEGIAKRADALRVGSAFEEPCEVPPIVSRAQFDKVMAYVATGKSEGARLVAGGTGSSDAGFYVRPTVFADVMSDMTIAKEEIFGPVGAVIAFDDENDAVRIANDTPFGLSAAIFTSDAGRLQRMVAQIDAGIVWGNTTLEFDTAVPFGGFRLSGTGKELGPDSIDAFTRLKTSLVRHN